MNQSLFLVSDKISIGVIRNPYERVITEYHNSINYIGLDKWLNENKMPLQKAMYKDCDILIRLEDWEHELEEQNLVVKDTSILDNLFVAPMWEQWYTLSTQSSVALVYKEDITTFGYSI
tara:strand:+ start:296 stop:652 length:357 start_codon:yes stop_codon:yes gene_type:complete